MESPHHLSMVRYVEVRDRRDSLSANQKTMSPVSIPCRSGTLFPGGFEMGDELLKKAHSFVLADPRCNELTCGFPFSSSFKLELKIE